MINTLAYLGHVKELDCVVYGCHDQVTAHHRKALGMGSKQRNKQDVRHLSAIPICMVHHTELHSMPEKDFEAEYSIRLDKENLRCLTNWLEAQLG